MARVAENLVTQFQYPEVVYLEGDLGAGKTTLAREILQCLGHRGRVKSPTYSLYESYECGGLMVHHFDLYRLKDPEELEYLGIRDLVSADLLLIEWPDRGEGCVPAATVVVGIEYDGDAREIRIERASVI